jgi:hypothetical protein
MIVYWDGKTRLRDKLFRGRRIFCLQVHLESRQNHTVPLRDGSTGRFFAGAFPGNKLPGYVHPVPMGQIQLPIAFHTGT